MPETASQHIGLVDGRHFQRLHGSKREAEEADPQMRSHQIVRHGRSMMVKAPHFTTAELQPAVIHLAALRVIPNISQAQYS